MTSDGWRVFGTYGADRDPGNIHGGTALGRELENVLERMITEGGIKSPVTTRRGLMARMRYLTTHQGGPAALADAGITATPATLRAWIRGTRRPRPANAERIDTAYWTLRARNVLANPGGLKQHLNRGGRGTSIEIHPVNQDTVLESRRRDNLRVRRIQGRYIWDDAVDAMAAGDEAALAAIWVDLIQELDSDYGAYTYVSQVGLGA
ncbi:MAG: hypothetical protein HOV68_24845 [Streptomycetaceae bacterium]|nr:hypothetical protein [Streptomycetaceae bacterium]